MNARMYDPLNGRMLSADNVVQDHTSTQGFNKYSYCLNNPLKFTDPTGNYVFVDDAIAGAIGGFINLGVNLFKGNVHHIGQGMGYFGAGAASGVLALYGPAGWAAGGAILGASNAALGGGSKSEIGESAITGMFSGLIGGAAGQWASQGIGGVVINGFNVTSPVLKGAIGGAIGGAAGGYAGGFASAFIATGDASISNQAGIQGLATGSALGFATGAVAGYGSAIKSKINPWTGRPKNSITIGENMSGRVVPVSDNLGSETIRKDWPSGLKNNLPAEMQFNEEWIQIKMEEGYYIYDAGPDASRNFSSRFYNMELQNMQNSNYNNTYRVHYFKSVEILIIYK